MRRTAARPSPRRARACSGSLHVRLLVVEDDLDLNRQLVAALEEAGYAVDKAFDGEEGHFLGDTEPYDAIVLDIGLPKMDGLSVLEEWRRAGRKTPVLMLTARDSWSDKVQGFDAGADDYVPKPFHMEEVLARLRALMRRAAGHASSEIVCGPVRLDTRSSRVTVEGNPVKPHLSRIPAARVHDAPSGSHRVAQRTGRAHLRPGLRSRFEHRGGVRRAPAQETGRRHHPDGARTWLSDRNARRAFAACSRRALSHAGRGADRPRRAEFDRAAPVHLRRLLELRRSARRGRLSVRALSRPRPQRAFDDRLNVYLRALVADVALSADEGGALGQMGEPQFELTNSGWYWQVTRIDGPSPLIRSSRSLFAERLPVLSEIGIDPDQTGLRSGSVDGPDGRPLRLLERVIDVGDGRAMADPGRRHRRRT